MSARLGIVILLSLVGPGTLHAQFAFYDSLNGIHWAQIEPPSAGDLGSCQILREGLGYVFSSEGGVHEYDASRPQPWRRLPKPEPYTIFDYFALAPDDIWAIVEVPEQYNRSLFHWDGKKWSPAFSGNAQNIRTLVFASPQEGWIGCDYGEFWHYKHGQWGPEPLPTFMHIHNLRLLQDGALYAHCRAPEQNVLLRFHADKWQTLLSNVKGALEGALLTPQQHLLIMNDQDTSVTRFASHPYPIWRLPLISYQLFPNGRGYGVRHNAIYSLEDTVYSPLVETPAELREVCLFNERFSWITGTAGFILAPQKHAAIISTLPEQSPWLIISKFPDLYGMAVLQNRPGESSHLYFVQTERANGLFSVQDFKNNNNVSAFNQAQRFNVEGPSKYADRFSYKGENFTNYDQAITTGDLNGDGLDDLIVTSMYGHPFVYLHSGHDYYFEATAYSGLQQWGYVEQRPMLSTLFDADRDGDLDLFIACQYQSNAFFINNGRGQFREVTQASGLSSEGGGIGGYAADFDGDGWEDLYVTVFNRPNLMYRNLGVDAVTGLPRFADSCVASGEACWPEIKQSQGATIGDYDNDGDFDIFVCNLEAGNRLLQNDNTARFTDVTKFAGLAGNDQSFGATFFDAENDGDLDLLVANRGKDRFYRNTGQGRFQENNEYLHEARDRLHLSMFPSRQFGGSSTGVLAFDADSDEDLDLLVSNFDDGLFFFQNNVNLRGTSLQIFPEGIVSNRAAVGARVFLYEAGKLGDPAALAGSRLIASTDNYGCSPQKVAFFGVSTQKEYDAKIVFPSGHVREMRGLRGGERRVVAEIEGLGASALKAKRTLANLALGYRSREKLALLVLGSSSSLLLIFLGKKYVGLSVFQLKWLSALYAISFLLVWTYWFARENLTYVLRPTIISASALAIALSLLRTQRLYRAQPVSLELLQERLNAFDHGRLVRQFMDSLAFFAENYEPEVVSPAAARQRMKEAVEGALHFIGIEIEAIRTYQNGLNFAMDLAHGLDETWGKLKQALARLQKDLSATEKLDHAHLTQIASLQISLRELIAAIQKRLHSAYRTDAVAVISAFLRQFDHGSVKLTAAPALPAVRIKPEDLVYALGELIENALRQSDGRPSQITLALYRSLDELHLEIQDNGGGIPQNLWETIFRSGYTTKPGGRGGFGLYSVRKRLERYGGRVFVAQSAPGEGTTMRICLKVVE